MKAFFQTIVHCALAHRACVVNQKSLRIGQKTPPYPLRTLSVPVKAFTLLLALGLSGNAWGDAQFDEVYMVYNLNGEEKNYSFNANSGHTDALNGATITSDFTITKIYMKYRKYEGNVCGGQLWYKNKDNTQQYFGDKSWIFEDGCWSYSDNDKAGSQLKNESCNLEIANKNNASGVYTLEMQWQLWGSASNSSNCGDNNWYFNNGNEMFKWTYTILPPRPNANPSANATGAISGDGTSKNPWIVEVGNTLIITGTATQEWEDDNSDLMICTSNSTKASNYSSSIRYTSENPTESTQVTIYYRYVNSSAEIVSKDNRSKTVYYQFVKPRTVNFDAGTGSVTPPSLTEETYGAGITLPSATPQTDCAAAGWTFAGWAKASQAETTTAPELLAAGSTYTDITDGETLYAVYKITQGAVASTLTKYTSNSIVDGDKVVIVASDNDGSYLMTQKISSSYAGYAMFSNDAAVIDANPTYYWTLIAQESEYLSNAWLLSTGIQYLKNTSNSADLSLVNENPSFWTIKYSDSKFILSSSQKLSCRNDLTSGNKYKFGGATAQNKGVYNLDLYKYVAGSAGTTTYHSNPVAAAQYDLTFDLNGGTGTAPETQKHKQLDEITEFPSVTDFEKTGFRCIGWNTTADATTALTSYIMPGEAATLYAVWVPTYAITWIVNGETIRTDLPISGETISAPTTNPASTNNRVFVGWSATQITGHANTFTDFEEHDCDEKAEIWYAVFATPEYTKANSLTDGETYIITSLDKNGKVVYLPNNEATNASPALNYAVDVNGNKISTVVTPDMLWTFSTSDANWLVSHIEGDKTYYLETTTTANNVRVKTDNSPKTWTITSTDGAFTMDYNQTESQHLGTKDNTWYNSTSDKNFDNLAITFYTPAGTYRNYTTAPSTATYSVVYDLNGGEGTAINQHELLTGATITLPAAPSKFGYSFTGWNDGSQTYNAGATYTIGSADVTLTAQWEIVKPTRITINSPKHTLIVGETVQMSVSFEPDNLLDSQKGVVWSVKSGDESFVSVDQTGLVTTHSCISHCTIYATSTVEGCESIRGEYVLNLFANSCPGYSFRYGTKDTWDWNDCDPVCFTETDKDDGYNGKLFISDLFTIPNKPKFEVWWQGRTEGWTEQADMSALPLHHLHSDHSLSTLTDGKGLGATGYLVIYGGYNTHNKYIDFMPDGYVLRLGSGETWTSVPFHANGNIWSTTWETDIVELTNNITSGKFYVGVKTAEDYVWLEGISNERDMTAMGKKSGKGEKDWGSNIGASDNREHGKFRIYANSNDANGNWFCHFVPYYQIAFNTDGGSVVAPGYVSIEAESKSYTVTMSPETTPTRVGYKFAGWNDGTTTHTETWTINDISQNISLAAVWNKVNTLTFHYDGFTTDCDEQWSVATGEEITLPDGKVVAGKTFNGWSDGNGNTYTAGASYTMPASDVTLTATYTSWTITLNYNGTLQTPEVPETGVVLPTTVPESVQGAVNNIFIGFTKTSNYSAIDLPDDFVAAGSVYTPAEDNETLYALYRQGDAEYKLIKDIKNLRLGAHVVLASIDEDYAMGKEFIEGQDTLPAIVVTKDGDNETISFGKDVQEWVLTTSSEAGRNATYQGTWIFQCAAGKLASSNKAGKVNLGANVSEGSSFRIAIDASGRATVQCVATSYNINTLSMGDNGAFGFYNPNSIDAPDLAIYQHIGTKYVTAPTAVYRVKSVDMINGRLDGNDYYAENETVKPQGYANDGYSSSNTYRYYNEDTRVLIGEHQEFTMPAYNVVDSLNNRILQETLTFIVPECVTQPEQAIVDGNTIDYELPTVADVNAWRFAGWTKAEVTEITEARPEIFTTYTIPHLKKDSAETFYAIYSYDGLETEGFVLSTVNNGTTYYLGEYVSGSTNRYFRAVTDKAQALVLYNKDGKLYYHSADTLAYLKANNQSGTYNLLTTNEANATVWTITPNDNGTTTLSCTVNGQTRKLQLYNNNRYSIYTNTNDPVSEKALSYTTNPVCDVYVHYFASDNAETPEFSYKLGDDGKAAQYYPQNECGAKRFIGWSENKVTTLQQTEPALVDFAAQTFDRDVNLYAVYAAENGGKITNEYDKDIAESIGVLSYFKTEQDSGMASLNTRYTFHNANTWMNTSGVYHIRLTRGSGVDTSYVTTSLIRGLKQIQVTYSNIQPKVYISSDGTEWTNVKLTKNINNYYATPETPGDYYVAYCIEKSETTNNSNISALGYKVIPSNRYWLSDYSTNCNTAETATMSFQNEDQSSAHEAITAETIGQVITLPTPKMAGKHFEHWTINGDVYNAGDEYKLSHDVTATATWSDPQLVCTPETLYVVSAKGKTVRSSQTINISCPEITEGTLTIADNDNNNGNLHAVITNAEADTETGLNATVAIEFTPSAQNVSRNATMTATIGEAPNQLQVQFNVQGYSLPDDFVIAHQGSDSKWYALPADITAFGTYKGYEITLDESNNATAPQSAVYHLGAVTDDNGHIRLTPTDTTALQTSASTSVSAKTKIKVGKISDDTDSRSLWTLLTTDNSSFTFVNTAANNSLKFNNDKFGMYAEGTNTDTLFRIFKVTTSTITIPITVTNWTENGFSFTTTATIPDYDEFRLIVDDVQAESAEIAKSFDLYNVTSSVNFGPQQMIQLQWFKSSKLVASGSVVTPIRVTENTTLSSLLTEEVDAKSLDIVVASGTLTVDAKATIHNLDICAGATVAIINDTLTATTLSFHGGLTSTESNYEYDVPRLYIQKENCTTPGYLKKNARIYYYLNVNADNYYPFTVPFKTTGANIRYASRPNTDIQSIWGNAIVISQYNGEARGKGETTTTKYWKDVAYTNELTPGVGYIITAKKLKGEPYATLRIMMMASDIDATTDAVSVGAWGVDDDKIAWYNKGWNYIANPYTAMLTGSEDETYHAIQSGTEVRYATIPSPTVDGYDQVLVKEADLKPFYGFFIQAGATGNYNFVKSCLHTSPAYLLAEEKPEQEAYINLEGATMHDPFGLIMGPNYSSDYEFNADLSKELGTANDLRAWLMTGEMKMAYLAVDDETAATLIPLNLRTPAESEYTFSLRESSRVDDLEGLYLYDYENGTVTNLINSDYTFSAPTGAVDNRFALNAIRTAQAPTELGGQTDRQTGGGDPPHKRLIDGHIYIIVNGATFNAEGKEVTK